MRHETLLRVIIATFAIILIVLATFVYGNVQRSKQKASTPTNQATVENPSTSSTTQDQPTSNQSQPSTTKQDEPTASQPAQTQATPSTGNTNTTQPTTSIPATGGGAGVVPMTILSVLTYLYIKSRKVQVQK